MFIQPDAANRFPAVLVDETAIGWRSINPVTALAFLGNRVDPVLSGVGDKDAVPVVDLKVHTEMPVVVALQGEHGSTCVLDDVGDIDVTITAKLNLKIVVDLPHPMDSSVSGRG